MADPLPAGKKARRKPPKIDENALSLALVHHIDDLKRGARGRITQVHHIKMGWMTLADYYDLQKFHEVKADLVPMVAAAINGGYKLKQAIFQSEFTVEILGSGVGVPIGPALIGLTVGAAIAAQQAGDNRTAILLLACLVLPFGEVYLLYIFGKALFGWGNDIAKAVDDAAKGGWLGLPAAIAAGADPQTLVAVGVFGESGAALEAANQQRAAGGAPPSAGVGWLLQWLFGKPPLTGQESNPG